MKLRIYRDSIRLRLRRPELHALLETGFVEETTAFTPVAELVYRLEVGGETIHASLEKNLIRIIAPRLLVKQWASGDQIGIAAEQPAGNRSLRILIEKDFACKDGNSEESQEGAFENPAGQENSPVKC